MKNFKDYLCDKFWNDMVESYTPDIPFLRYEGPIPVFMYGSYCNFEAVRQIMSGKAEPVVDYRIITTNAFTAQPHLYMNAPVQPEFKYRSILLPQHMKLDLDTSYLTKRKVRGTLFSVSLKGIQVLDKFFENERKFYRDTVDLVESSKHEFKSVYTYYISGRSLSDDHATQPMKLKTGLRLSGPLSSSVGAGTPGISNNEMVYI